MNHLNFSQKELSDLLINACNGDSKSFEKLSANVKEISYSYFLSKQKAGRINLKEDVEDLTNNVYLSFAEQYQNINNIENWLRRVLFLSYINWYKKNKVQKSYEFFEDTYNPEEKQSADNGIDSGYILNFVNKLSTEKQQVIKLRFWKDMKFSDIAVELKKSEDAVKKMFYRAIEEIKTNVLRNK